MPDPLSLMLDSMILAVDEGHSYDGIVSLPGIGLEDFGRRPGRLGGWLDDCMELIRVVKPRVMGLFSRKVTPPTPSMGVVSPVPPVDMVPPSTPPVDVVSPALPVDMVPPAPPVDMIPPTPPVDMVSPAPPVDVISPTPPGPDHEGGDGQQPRKQESEKEPRRRQGKTKDLSKGEEEGEEVPHTPPGPGREGGSGQQPRKRDTEKEPRRRQDKTKDPSQGKEEGEEV